MRNREAGFTGIGGRVRALVAGLVVVLVSATPLEAKRSEAGACEVVGSVIGGVTGFLVGGFIGGNLERAVYEGEDAGLTGALLGGFTGALLGIRLARGACDHPYEEPLRQPRGKSEEEAWREHLAYLSQGSGVWFTSNADYMQAGEPPEYAMGYRLGPGGLTVTGCLWGRDGERRPVYWQFFSGWDPVEGKVLMYQASPSGVVGLGHGTSDGAVSTSEQTFTNPDGTRSRIRHRSVQVDPNIYETSSFNHDGEGWTPRRSYRWMRQPEGAEYPCDAW